MPNPRPSPRLLKFIDAYGSVNAAAEVWGIQYLTLDRFIKHGAGMSLGSAMKLSKAVGVPMDELFVEGETK